MFDAPTSYVLRHGESLAANLVAGQVVRTIADNLTTAGGFGAVVLESTIDRGPIPLHYHEREHDTWLCTRGRLQIWFGNESRILTEGDFAYVQPGDVHAYQCLSPRTQFFGIVAPGGWEGFFGAAGEAWAHPGLPEPGHPFDFSRMGPAMGKYGVMRQPDATYAASSNGDATDRTLPSGPASYVLQQGYGARVRAWGHLCTTLLPLTVSRNFLEMRVVEGVTGARTPRISHARTHVFLYVIEGEIAVDLGGERVTAHAGDAVNIPAATAYATEVIKGHSRWVLSSAHGNGLEVWDRFGTKTEGFTAAPNPETPMLAQDALAGIDATLQD